jgi:hypothetical protein
MSARSKLSRLRRFAALPATERRFLLRAWASLPAIWLATRAFGWRRAQRLLAPRARATTAQMLLSPWRAEELVRIASRHSWPANNCMARSQLLAREFTRAGVRHTMRLGSCREGTQLIAHAWVEVDGVALGEPPDVATRFPAWLPPSGA